MREVEIAVDQTNMLAGLAYMVNVQKPLGVGYLADVPKTGPIWQVVIRKTTSDSEDWLCIVTMRVSGWVVRSVWADPGDPETFADAPDLVGYMQTLRERAERPC